MIKIYFCKIIKLNKIKVVFVKVDLSLSPKFFIRLGLRLRVFGQVSDSSLSLSKKDESQTLFLCKRNYTNKKHIHIYILNCKYWLIIFF